MNGWERIFGLQSDFDIVFFRYHIDVFQRKNLRKRIKSLKYTVLLAQEPLVLIAF